MNSSIESDTSLYEKLGGEVSIKAVVEEFYKRVLDDASLAPVFQNVDMGNLKRHQALFISQALGGPKQYDGREMDAAHQGLNITDGQFNSVAGHLSDALATLGVESADIDTIISVVGSLREQVVAAEAPSPFKPVEAVEPDQPAETAESTGSGEGDSGDSADSLYAKLGGEVSIKAVVEEFYKRVLDDASLAPVFQNVDMGNLKRHQALFISQALGGPRQYDGREMDAAHQGLNITDGQFNSVAGHLSDALATLGVESADIDTIISVVGTLREQVVSAEAPSPFKPVEAVEPDQPAESSGSVEEDSTDSLYAKLGGEATIKAVVEEFYKRVLNDASLAPVFQNVDMGNLKRHQALFISQALGGPRQYDGRSMFEAHKSYLIQPEQFDAVAGHLAATLQHFDVAQEDINTVIGTVAPLKRDIVMNHFKIWLRGA